MEVINGIFSAFGLSASAGLNAYIPLLVVSLLNRFTDLITLQEPWDNLSNGWIIALLVGLSVIEFFADKIPAVNHLNDAVQTVIRPAAGAVAFASTTQVVTNIHPVLAMGMGLLIAGSVHAAKAGALRPAVTTTTGGLGNAAVSVAEDVIAATISILAILIPVIIGTLLVMFASWVIWLLWRRSNRIKRQQGL